MKPYELGVKIARRQTTVILRFPPPVKPEPLIRVFPDVAFNDTREQGGVLLNVPELVSCSDQFDFFPDHHPVAAVSCFCGKDGGHSFPAKWTTGSGMRDAIRAKTRRSL